MPVDKGSENTLDVETVSIDVDDAEERIRLAFKLLLKAAARNTITVKGKRPDRHGGFSE